MKGVNRAYAFSLVPLFCFIVLSLYSLAQTTVLQQPDPVYYSVNRDELLKCAKTQMKIFPIPWVAACAREGTIIYEDDSLTGKGFKAAYLQRFAVLDKIGDKLKLKELGKPKPDTGWTSMKNLIYLPRALKDERTAVYQKVVFTHIEEHLHPGEIGDITFYKSPGSYQPGNILETRALGTLRIAYVYAWENNDYEDSPSVLIGDYPSIESVSKDENAFKKTIYGWCKITKLFPWNSRMALIPNKEKNARAYIFTNGPELETFFRTAGSLSEPEKDTLLTFDSHKMWQDSKWPFFLEGKLNSLNQDYIRLVCQVDARYANVSGIPLETLKKEMEDLKGSGQDLDVMFLLDATKSMRPYIEAVAMIVNEVMERLKENNSINQEHLRFGAAVYRDYVDGENKFDIEPLTSNLSSIKKRLNDWAQRAKSSPLDTGEAAWPEALFNGINQVIDRSGYGTHNSRILIVIGDAGNHSRGYDNHTGKSIAQRLASKRCNCIMVKVNHPCIGGEKEKQAMELFRTDMETIRKHYNLFFIDEAIKHNVTFTESDLKKSFVLDLERVIEPSVLKTQILKEHSRRISDSVDSILECYQRLIEGERIATEPAKGIIKTSVKPFSSSTDGMYINPIVFENLKVRFGSDFPKVLDELRQKRAYIMKFGYSVEKDPRRNTLNQFKNVYLFRKSEINKIKYDLDTTLELLKPRKVNALWKELTERVYGEEYDPKRTINEYAQMNDGITYKELSILFDKTQEQLNNMDFSEFDQIEEKIIEVKARLEDILNDEASERLFGPKDDPYVWLYENELP
jgi:hypothetical protein